MKSVLLTAVAAAALVLFAAPAGASGHPATSPNLTKHDRQVIEFFKHHPRAAATPTGGRVLSRLLPRVVAAMKHRDLLAAKAAVSIIPAGVCESCWDRVADCESGDNWGLVTGNGFYWGLQWVPSTWDGAADRHGLPHWSWYIANHSAPSREQQILAAHDMALSNWPVCGARY